MPRRAWIVVPLLAIAAACQPAVPGPASRLAAADAGTGEATAVEWCGGCHVIGVGDAAEGEPPSFGSILELRTPESVRHYLTWERHPGMPALALESEDIDFLFAYFSHLQGR